MIEGFKRWDRSNAYMCGISLRIGLGSRIHEI